MNSRLHCLIEHALVKRLRCQSLWFPQERPKPEHFDCAAMLSHTPQSPSDLRLEFGFHTQPYFECRM